MLNRKHFKRIVSFVLRFIRRFFFSIFETLSLGRFLYIRYPSLLFYDISKWIYSLFCNPYTLLRRSSESSILKRGNIYGETTWASLKKICREFDITSDMSVCDLGCGLGNVCFWFRNIIGCSHVVGIDNQDKFIRFASKVQKKLVSKHTVFLNTDFRSISFVPFSCVYLYGSSFSLKVIKEIVEALKSLQPGSMVISVSFALEDFAFGKDHFYTEKLCNASFPWGSTFVFKNVRKKATDIKIL